MPTVQVDLRRELFQEKGTAISRAIHEGLIEGLDMPADDLFQVFRPHDEGEIIFSPDFGGADRRDLVMMRITMVHMFPPDTKQRMYAALVKHLEAACLAQRPGCRRTSRRTRPRPRTPEGRRAAGPQPRGA